MRLVCMADTHMFHGDWSAVPAGDVLVHAGDMTRGGTREELVCVRDFLAALPHPHKVLVTHGPPHGILDDAGGYRGTGGSSPAGCEALRDRVRELRPRLHVFGHIHTNQGVVDDDGVRYVNCTTDECERAPLVVDLPG